MKQLEEELGKRKSIIHIQNIFLKNALNVYLDRETRGYMIGYELKFYSMHNLLYKISKNLVSEIRNPIQINTNVDINVNENYRLTIKSTDDVWKIRAKNVTMRIIPSRYDNLQPLYGTIEKYGWRHTGAGGRDQIKFEIPECPIISNSMTINGICYKQIASQVSGGGSHGVHTYIILSPKSGNFEIGTWLRVSNQNRGGHQHSYTFPVSVSL